MSHLKNQLEALEAMINAVGECRAKGTGLDAMCPLMLEARQAARRAHEYVAKRIEGIETAGQRQKAAEEWLYKWACGEVSQADAYRAVVNLGFKINMTQPDTGNVMIAHDTRCNGKQVKLYL